MASIPPSDRPRGLHSEFRRITNDGCIKHREKDFFKLPSVLALYGLDTIGLTAKRDMIARILTGPPYSAQDRLDILDYCQSDTLMRSSNCYRECSRESGARILPWPLFVGGRTDGGAGSPVGRGHF
jgi:hypothetical protein